MKTFETEKNNIPEGATHHGIYGCDTDVYFKKDGDTFLQWKHGNWSLSGFVHHKWVNPIPKPEVVEWKNGDPILWKNGNGEFLQCNTGRYIGYDEIENKHIFIRTDVDTYRLAYSKQDGISKPESPEEKEQREKEEAAWELYQFSNLLVSELDRPIAADKWEELTQELK